MVIACSHPVWGGQFRGASSALFTQGAFDLGLHAGITTRTFLALQLASFALQCRAMLDPDCVACGGVSSDSFCFAVGTEGDAHSSGGHPGPAFQAGGPIAAVALVICFAVL